MMNKANIKSNVADEIYETPKNETRMIEQPPTDSILKESSSNSCQTTILDSSLNNIPTRKFIPKINSKDDEYYSYSFVETMRRKFLQNGGLCLSSNKLLQSKYLRELSELCLDGHGRVWQALADNYGNYIRLRLITKRVLAKGFVKLYKAEKPFLSLISTHPELLKRYKEMYK